MDGLRGSPASKQLEFVSTNEIQFLEAWCPNQFSQNLNLVTARTLSDRTVAARTANTHAVASVTYLSE